MTSVRYFDIPVPLGERLDLRSIPIRPRFGARRRRFGDSWRSATWWSSRATR